jgi:hypothetical protein
LGFIVYQDNKYFGPLTNDELKILLRKYKISLSNFIWSEDTQNWKMIGEIEEFKSFLPQTPTMSTDLPCFYIYTNKSIQGPITFEEVKQRLRNHTLSYYDFVLLAGSKEWKRLKNFNEFYTKEIYPPALMEKNFKIDERVLPKKELDFELAKEDSKSEVTSYKKRKEGSGFEISNKEEWYIKFGDDEIGPLKFTDASKMIKDSKVSKSDYIRKIHEKKWQKISEVYEYNVKTTLKTVQTSEGQVEKIFVTRSSPRVTYYSMCAIESNQKVINGVCSSISAGGCFIETNGSKFTVGQRIIVTIKPGAIPITIKAHAEVSAILEKKPKGLGIKFIEISINAKKEIEGFVDKFLTKTGGMK